MNEDTLRERLQNAKVDSGPNLLEPFPKPRILNWLDVVVRKLINSERITRSKYMNKISEYADRKVLTTTQKNNTANNTMSGLVNGYITYYTFIKFVNKIMKYKIKKIEIVFEREDGTQFSEIVEDNDVD